MYREDHSLSTHVSHSSKIGRKSSNEISTRIRSLSFYVLKDQTDDSFVEPPFVCLLIQRIYSSRSTGYIRIKYPYDCIVERLRRILLQKKLLYERTLLVKTNLMDRYWQTMLLHDLVRGPLGNCPWHDNLLPSDFLSSAGNERLLPSTF